MLRFIVDREQSLKEFTDNHYAQASFVWTYLLKNKEIKINGKKTGANVLLQAGDEVCYYLTPKQSEKPAFYVLYEDENILIADKESGVNSEAVFAALRRERECYFIHRLDRNTKGLLIFALTEEAENRLLTAFRERAVEKRYAALCFGRFERKSDLLTAYLKKDADRALVRIFDQSVSGSEKIVTEYSVVRETEDVTELEVVLHTGKTHQIRAHLAHIGHPILGDMKYGVSEQNKAKNANRQCLIAKSLRFQLSGKLSYLNERIFLSRFTLNELFK